MSGRSSDGEAAGTDSGRGQEQPESGQQAGQGQAQTGIGQQPGQGQSGTAGDEAAKAGQYGADADGSAQTVGGEQPAVSTVIWVHVCGAVRKAGVYELPAGSRVFEAVQEAGTSAFLECPVTPEISAPDGETEEKTKKNEE